MSDPTVRIVVTVLVALVCLGLALTLGTKAIAYALTQIRAMRPKGADSEDAAKARVLARGRLKNLAFLFVFSAVPASISYAHLIDYATQSLGLTGGLEYLVPLALDEAALYLMMLAFNDVDAGESSAVNRLLVWAFAGGSAWFNWIQAPRGESHQGAPQFFAAMSLAAGILFERGLVNVRRAQNKANGTGRRPLPRVGLLRWATAPRETAGMMRLAITEPVIRTEEEALAAIRVRRALRAAQKDAQRTAKAQAAAQAPAHWWRRRTVVSMAQPVLSLPSGTTAPAAALATVLAPYARAEAAREMPEDAAHPLALEPLLTEAAQIAPPAEAQAQHEAFAAYVEQVEELANRTEQVLAGHGTAHAQPLPQQRAEQRELECFTGDADQDAGDVPESTGAGRTAAARGAAEPRITVRLQDDEPGNTEPEAADEDDADEPAAGDVPDLSAYSTKKAALLALYDATIKPGDPRTTNAIAQSLVTRLKVQGITYDRAAANRAVAERHKSA
uniref:ORF502 protein n=1 Tax=Streptomyces noursei TaxID=1971 RepID=Q9RHR4_STRNR|nr:DUF2637 domain-containing protein [Streptomyces noursei]BAA89267.1 ORF502 [Streptomyces noursei]BAD80785.1 hypothetical protein [Streptomyces noursei]